MDAFDQGGKKSLPQFSFKERVLNKMDELEALYDEVLRYKHVLDKDINDAKYQQIKSLRVDFASSLITFMESLIPQIVNFKKETKKKGYDKFEEEVKSAVPKELGSKFEDLRKYYNQVHQLLFDIGITDMSIRHHDIYPEDY